MHTMTGTITVWVDGPVGLDEPEELLEELGRATGLTWRADARDEDAGGTLDGSLATLVLETVISGVGTAAVQAAVGAVLDKWRSRQLDPPPVRVVLVDPAPDPDPDSPAPEGS
ncbi:hypothetical protein AB0J38_33375 [Streptomyces sp. NPDC050095]|uniref:hypothetical protein n=1 Tax=unclassified Streptomyces TaxID=2593676 RepID=UPI00341DCC97